MQYVNLGRTGLRVSRLCLGTMTFGSAAWRIDFFDKADMYSRGVSEEIPGRALRELTTRDQHLDTLIAALDVTLDDDECRLLEEPYVPHPVLGHR